MRGNLQVCGVKDRRQWAGAVYQTRLAEIYGVSPWLIRQEVHLADKRRRLGICGLEVGAADDLAVGFIVVGPVRAPRSWKVGHVLGTCYISPDDNPEVMAVVFGVKHGIDFEGDPL